MIPIYYIYLDVSRFLFNFLTFELKKNERFSLLRFFYFRSSKWWWWGELIRIGIGMNRNVILLVVHYSISLCFRFLLPCLPVFLFFAAFICNGFLFCSLVEIKCMLCVNMHCCINHSLYSLSSLVASTKERNNRGIGNTLLVRVFLQIENIVRRQMQKFQIFIVST
jgi:hypothetical protein